MTFIVLSYTCECTTNMIFLHFLNKKGCYNIDYIKMYCIMQTAKMLYHNGRREVPDVNKHFLENKDTRHKRGSFTPHSSRQLWTHLTRKQVFKHGGSGGITIAW